MIGLIVITVMLFGVLIWVTIERERYARRTGKRPPF